MSLIRKSELIVIRRFIVCGVSNTQVQITEAGGKVPVVGMYSSIPSNSGNVVSVTFPSVTVLSSKSTGIYTILDDTNDLSSSIPEARNYYFNWGTNSPTGNPCNIAIFALKSDYLQSKINELIGSGFNLPVSESTKLDNVNTKINSVSLNMAKRDDMIIKNSNNEEIRLADIIGANLPFNYYPLI